MEEAEIKKELVKFNLTDSAIATMRDQYMGLTIKDLEDVKGYRDVHEARMVVVKKRTTVTKTGKKLREDANRFNRAVLTEEKRILDLLFPIENHLNDEETRIDNEKAKIKAEAEAKEAARIQARVEQLEALGMGLVSNHYRLPYGEVVVNSHVVKLSTMEEWGKIVFAVQEAVNVENTRLEEIERIRKANDARLAQVAAEQEAERKRLDGIAKWQATEEKRIADEQARQETVIKAAQDQREAEIKAEQDRIRKGQEDREAAIRAAQDAIEAEKKAIADAKQQAIDDAIRAKELEQARKEAAEQARIEAEVRAAREAQEREVARLKDIEDARLAKIAAAEEARRQEELRPDKMKLLGFADCLDAMAYPMIKNKKLGLILTAALKSISEIAQGIRNDVGLKGGNRATS